MELFLCDCTQHALAVNRFSVEDDKEIYDFPDVEFSIWQGPSNGIYLWREKLQHIWYIIRWGHPYADFVILDKKKTTELRDYLTKILGEM